MTSEMLKWKKEARMLYFDEKRRAVEVCACVCWLAVQEVKTEFVRGNFMFVATTTTARR